mmetsp:Transcript_39922/g.118877  ORF Transcript_39922/g.118877 Transcript_39922/m.118877 type:complete len:122 (+) Transcript_39922:125-490(+)
MSAVAATLGAAMLAVADAAQKSSGAIQQEFSLNGKLWRQLYNAERQAPYFYNVETAEAQWNDPRKGDGTEKTWLASLVLFAPFIVVFLMGAAYLLYIKIHHPDFLQPPKKAKGGMRKARGK